MAESDGVRWAKMISRAKDRGVTRERLSELYSYYLKTEHWKELRLEVMRRDGYCCVHCGSTIRCQVHHLTYERLGRERLSDLVTLCRKCHERTHGL